MYRYHLSKILYFIHHCSLFVFYYTTVIVVSPLSCYVFYHFVTVPWITIPAVFYMVALVFKVLYFCFLTEELFSLIQNLIHLWLVFHFPPFFHHAQYFFSHPHFPCYALPLGHVSLPEFRASIFPDIPHFCCS